MSSVITTQHYTEIIDGLLVDTADILDADTSVLNSTGEAIASITGSTDVLPQINPVTCTATVTGGHVVVTVGGSGEWLVTQGRMCDNIPTTVLTQSPPDGSLPRTDILAVKYNELEADGATRTYQKPDGSDDTTTVFQLTQSVTWNYVEGTPGGGTPSTPAGYQLFAIIPVAAGHTGALTVNIQFQTPKHLLTGSNTDPVTSINGLDDAVVLVGGTDIGVSVSGQNITIAFTGSIVNSINSISGALTIAGGSGISVGTAGSTVTITSTVSSTTVNGVGGAVAIAAGADISVTTAGSTITIDFTGTVVSSVNTLAGALTITSADGSIGVTSSGTNIDLTADVGLVGIGGSILETQNNPVTGIALVLPGSTAVKYNVKGTSIVTAPGSGSITIGGVGSSTDGSGVGFNGGTVASFSPGAGSTIINMIGGTAQGGDTIGLTLTSGAGGLSNRYNELFAVRTA